MIVSLLINSKIKLIITGGNWLNSAPLKMKTLQHTTQNITAIVTEKTVYLVSNGKIYKQFGNSTFNAKPFVETAETSTEVFEAMKAEFEILQAEKKQATADYFKAQALVAYEARRKDIRNLRAWRKGETEAFLVVTYVESAQDGYSGNPSKYTRELVFGEHAAKERFNELKGSVIPEFEQGGYGNYGNQNNCYFVTEILQYYTGITIKKRLQITSCDKLEAELSDNADLVDSDRFAPSIEDYEIIVTFGRNSYNRYTRNKIVDVQERRTNSFRSSQTTTADLGCAQFAYTIADFCEAYPEEALRFGYSNQE